jgi:hypothetical protein
MIITKKCRDSGKTMGTNPDNSVRCEARHSNHKALRLFILGAAILCIGRYFISISSNYGPPEDKSNSIVSHDRTTPPQTLAAAFAADSAAPDLKQEPKAAVDPALQFNKTNKSFLENGNGLVAVDRMNSSTPGHLWRDAESIPLEQLTKSPYSSLGKLCKLTGIVQQIEELPPDEMISPGKWSVILIFALNRNAPLGITSVEILYNGDTRAINPGYNITFAGYFVGTHEGQNLVGGTVEALVFITNTIKLRSFSRSR